MKLTQEEIDALEDCISTRSDEGFETDIARQALEKIKAAQQSVQRTTKKRGKKTEEKGEWVRFADSVFPNRQPLTQAVSL